MAHAATAEKQRDNRAFGWSAAGGIVAAILTGIPMMAMGMLTGGPARLVGSDSLWVGWVVHIVAGVLFGTPFGFFAVRGYGRGALRGALYGLAIGVVFAWLALFTILDMPYFTTMGLLDVTLHVLWGVVIGLVAAWGLRRTEEVAAGRQRSLRTA